ncbi:Respiratory burst oxidase-like protein [Rhynchospora pubera]|uniref:Respiratory burst oxidase-like protein n=1 Tax=Rhynchospora pubera TaxID=906938 RepID=A0AAV8HX91_9POAL|nr:Respiratory burst oxidase-like protein [Rhynchospora pubera]
MVASQEFVVCPTSKLSQNNSDQDPDINGILIHSTNNMGSLSVTTSPENTPAEIEININFQDGQSCASCSKRSCPASIACSQNELLGSVDPKEVKGEAKLLSLPSLRTEFIECDANGDLKWKEVEVASDLACSSANTMCKVEASDTREETIQANSGNSKIRVSLDTCGRKICERITEKEIIQAILYSASVNKLTFTPEEAKECARLILEELQSDEVTIEINDQSAKSTYTPPATTWSTEFLSLKDRPHKALSSTNVLLWAHWRRVWIVTLWLAACVGLFTWKFVQYRHRSAFEVMGYCLCTAKGAAETLKLNMALVLLPVCRNTVTWLRKSHKIGSVLPFNDTINFHKLVAAGIIIGVILHAGVHLTCDFPRIVRADRFLFRQTIACDFGYTQPSYLDILASTEGWTGIAMVILMLMAFLLALKTPRRSPQSLPGPIQRCVGFNAFWYTHHVFIFVYVLLIIHSMFLFLAKDFTAKTTWMYLAVPILIYVGERIYRTIRSEMVSLKIQKARIYSGKVVSLEMKKPPGFTYRSGMYVFVQCPRISKFEWHPFSLTSAPDDDHLTMHIRSLGDWSYQFYSIFQEALLSGQPNLPKIAIDGPYGSASQDHAKYDIILLIGLGIGATPFISVLKDIANGLNKADKGKANRKRKAYFYWVTRDQGSFEWFGDVMKEVSCMDKNQGVIEMYNYLTSVFQEGDKRSALISAIQALHFIKNGVDIISKTPVRTQFARPNWPKVFSGLATRHREEKIGVFYCGPGSLGRQLERLCHGMTAKTTTRFVFHKEYF